MTPWPVKPLEERIAAKTDRTDGCWIWQAASSRKGYGQILVYKQNGRKAMYPAHRAAFELAFGPIADGMTIDHLCRNRLCVNPAHLEAVTNRVNILRGEGLTAQEARQTHCKNGHAFDLFNTRWYRGKRQCRACERAWKHADPRRHHRKG